MKRAVSLLLSAALLLGLLSACRLSAVSPAAADVWSAMELAEIGFGRSGCPLEDITEGRSSDDDREWMAAYIENACGIQEPWEDAAVIRATGASAFEIAVLRMESEDAAARAVPVLESYLATRAGDFAGYAPAAADMARAGRIVQAGPFAALFICPNPAGAAEAVKAALNGKTVSEPGSDAAADSVLQSAGPDVQNTIHSSPDRYPFTAPNVDDMSLYDTSAIRAAWESGDPAGLSKKDRETYDAAQKVLKKLIKSGMSDYEKEVAVYNWLVNNVNYDWTHQDRMKETPRESFEPYGGLVNRTAVCLGYATTFQLLMDLVGVECITVPGAAFASQEDHGWNMVRINGEWYCVDATWDANQRERSGRGNQSDWYYFNVISDYMANTNHQWDYANTPEATAWDQGRS